VLGHRGVDAMRDFVLAVLVITLGAILLFSDRGWVLSDQRRMVSHVAEVPKTGGPGLAELPYFVFRGGVHVPLDRSKFDSLMLRMATGQDRFAPTYEDMKQWPSLGYSVREWTLFGMPFGYFSEFDYVLYTRTPRETVMVPLEEEGMALLRKEVGRDLSEGFVYPFWRHLWGWLFVAGLALWGWLYHRGVVRRREELGLI